MADVRGKREDGISKMDDVRSQREEEDMQMPMAAEEDV